MFEQVGNELNPTSKLVKARNDPLLMRTDLALILSEMSEKDPEDNYEDFEIVPSCSSS